MPKPNCRYFQIISSSSSWSKTMLCILKEQIWLPECYGKNKLYFDQEEMLKIAWYCTHKFLDVPIPVAQVLRLFIQMFLSYGLYICIILETACHRATFRIFCIVLKRLHLKKVATKCSIFLHQLYFFMGRSWTFWGNKDHVLSGRQNEGVRGYKHYPTNCWPDKLLTTTIAIDMPKTYMQGVSSNFEQFFLVRYNFVYFDRTNMASK